MTHGPEHEKLGAPCPARTNNSRFFNHLPFHLNFPWATLLVAAATFLGSANVSEARQPHIVSPRAHFRGKTYAQWSAKWFQWSLGIPASGHPLADETGANAGAGQSGRVWFLGGVFNASGTVVRNITIQPGTALFFPIINADCSDLESDPWHGETESEMRTCAQSHMNKTSGILLEVDGKAVTDLSRYRVTSGIFDFTVPSDNVLGVAGPADGQAVSDGYYIMLAPLSKGEHTLHFGGTFDEFGYTLDITYHITVQR